MRNNWYNSNFKFIKEPVEFDKSTDADFLKYCLGSTLYMPGTKNILEKVLSSKFISVSSLVMCFEDSIREDQLNEAEKNVIWHLEKLAVAVKKNVISQSQIPLIFLRVRDVSQFQEFSTKLNKDICDILSGFVFPKFHSFNAGEYLNILRSINIEFDAHLYAMPIFEGHRIAFKETRIQELSTLKEIIDRNKDLILNLRVGGTDFSALFSVRRGINYSIYDIITVRDCLADILNVFGRANDDYILSGPVWEYFLVHTFQDIKDISTSNDLHLSIFRFDKIINEAVDGLLREVILDKANGFIGKTIIHPSHAKYVNALQMVTKEEYDDALQILQSSGGVVKSKKSNKMNEINPHKTWAHTVLMKAKAYGVVNDLTDCLKLVQNEN